MDKNSITGGDCEMPRPAARASLIRRLFMQKLYQKTVVDNVFFGVMPPGAASSVVKNQLVMRRI
jgi:secreted protein with Ig-like and vWFA domain